VAGLAPYGAHDQAIPKFLVPLGTERVTVFEETVAAANEPVPTLVATAAGVAPEKVKVTAVGLLLTPPPDDELAEPPQPETIRQTMARTQNWTA
jgi:hypothetical protein